MTKSFLDIGTLELYDLLTGHLILTSDTLQASGLNISATEEPIRAGFGNYTIGKKVHSSQFTISATDALFALEYIALTVSGDISVGANVFTNVTVTTTVANQITVDKAPQDFMGKGTIGRYRLASGNSYDFEEITFVGNVANAPNLPIGSIVCVRYMVRNESARTFTISSAFLPRTVRAVLTLPMTRSSAGGSSGGGSALIGHLEIEVPNLQFTVNQDIAITSSGTTTIDISGEAQSTTGGIQGGCNNKPYYAIIKEVIYDEGEFDNVKNIMLINQHTLELDPKETVILQVDSFYGGMTRNKRLDNSTLTFTVPEGNTSATVSAEGIVTASETVTGDTIISINVTDKPALETKAIVTVEGVTSTFSMDISKKTNSK